MPKGLCYGLLRLYDGCRLVHCHALQIGCAVECCIHLADLNGMALDYRISACRRCGGHLVQHSGRRHLSACHTVHTVIDKNYGDEFTAVCSVKTFGGSYCREVPVALVGEDKVLRPHPLDTCSHCCAASVSRFYRIDIEIIIDKHAAACRCDADRLVPEFHLIHDLCDEARYDTVAAARTIMEVGLFHTLRSSIYSLH